MAKAIHIAFDVVEKNLLRRVFDWAKDNTKPIVKGFKMLAFGLLVPVVLGGCSIAATSYYPGPNGTVIIGSQPEANSDLPPPPNTGRIPVIGHNPVYWSTNGSGGFRGTGSINWTGGRGSHGFGRLVR